MTELEIEKENKAIAQEYKELLRISYQTLTPTDKKLIRKAFDVAVDAHKDQRRKSGEAYIFHPIAVAKIVASEIGLGATSIAAALLHDVVEDTPITVHDIEKLVNQPVEGLLYDLNRDEATILTWIDDPKWINDYACAMVIRYLMNKLKIKKL